MTEEELFRLKTEVVLGKNINLRLASENDAAFILELRLNPLLNKYIGQTDPSLEKQKEWIENSLKKITDFHFIIENKEGKQYGTVAIYNIDYENGTAEWGRWVIKPGSFVFFPVESAVLVLNFAFTKLGLKKLTGGANNKNIQVVNFHKMYGAVSSVDETHTWFLFEEQNFIKILKLFKKFHSIQINNK